MVLKTLAELDDFELVDDDQDCRGWPVMDSLGQQMGTVRDMLVDTDAERVTTLVLDSGAELPARSVSFKDGQVFVAPSPSAILGEGIVTSRPLD